MFVNQLGHVGAAEFFGPIQQHETWGSYQDRMTQAALSIGTGAAAMLLLNPIAGMAVGLGVWLATPRLATHKKPKSQTQGG